MRLKIVEVEGKTYAEVQDGKPVFVGDDGREIAFDAAHSVATITRLNGEAKGHRERAEAAERAAKAFEGITDPAAALKAMQIVQGLDEKKLIDAGQVEQVKAAAIEAVKQQYEPFKTRATELEAELRAERIGGGFARSKFIAEKLAVPAQMVEATFGRHFDLADGKIIAKDASGNQIYSKARPGEPADFDEALETLVSASPFRDSIMKGLGQSGSGHRPSGGGGGKTISRAEFDTMARENPAGAAKAMADGVKITD